MAKTPGDAGLPAAATLNPNAPAVWEWKDFRFMIVLLVGMIYSIMTGFEAYSRFETWETTKSVQKATLIVGALSVVGMPFAVHHTVYLYLHLQRKEKNT
ncbi:hypothetical protein G7Y89_g10842 [Cudoniella acicularis]|uniref:Uncharacterized protein n=1 Tax=Cudoniella acicularis TaxID=354080 RepID=A0A8H4RBZ7_9HELO|nr:hypothetical protein G7Y89_g10842 [Cudoniella acicularis]